MKIPSVRFEGTPPLTERERAILKMLIATYSQALAATQIASGVELSDENWLEVFEQTLVVMRAAFSDVLFVVVPLDADSGDVN